MTNSGDRVGQHAAIGQAIVNGDAASAETLMREHMEAYLKFVVKTHPTLLDEVIDWMT
jgi:GntR family transcriptional repressor for pyruvate dehydrogenase complex